MKSELTIFCLIFSLIDLSSTQNSTCSYCRENQCRCSSSIEKTLNCSSFLLNLQHSSDCFQNQTWRFVDFSYRNLENLDEQKLLGLQTERFSFKSNSISLVDDRTFDSIGQILIELDFDSNFLTNLSSTWINSNFIALEKLHFSFNLIESFDQLENVLLPSLKFLNVSWNQFEHFPTQINQWKSLEVVDFSFNKIASIDQSILIDLQNLQWLSFASNRFLSRIDRFCLTELNSLKFLDLSSTQMKNVDNFLLAPLNSLRTLKIERVEMNCSPCFTSSVRSEPLEIIGQCFENGTLKFLNFSSSKSVQCTEKFSSQKFVRSSENRNRTTTIVVATLLSSVFLLVLIFALVFLYRCRKPKEIKQNPIDHRTSQLFNPVFVDSTKTENDFYRQTRKTSVSDASSQ